MPEQHDPFDAELRDRIGAAEARVRVSSTAPAGRGAAQGPSRWLQPAMVLATAAAAVVLAVFVIGQLPDRSTGDASPSPSAPEGVSTSARNGDFVLTLSSPRSTWTTEDAIQVTATLSYDGDAPSVEIGGAGGPVVFSLRQLEGGDAVLQGGQEMPCLRYSLRPDAPLVWPFEKGGGIADEPPFDRAFFEDPELRLPPGRWEVRAVLEYGDPDCGNWLELAVSITLDVLEADGSPGPSAVATEPPVSSRAPSPLGSVEPTTDLAWTKTGAFPADGTSLVTQIVRLDGTLLAIGLAYHVALTGVQPEPSHEARVWVSTDGRVWESIDQGDAFGNADLGTVITLPDGSLLALGDRYPDDDGGQLGFSDPAAWTSIDGRTWTEIAYPVERSLGGIVQGAQGYLAYMYAAPGTSERVTIWHSVDGRAWEQVHSLGEDEYVRGTGAGPEGFVVSARGTDDRSAIWASGDGRQWFPATSPPTGGAGLDVVPVGPDWVGVAGFADELWFSADGLNWSPRGPSPLREIVLNERDTCAEFPGHLASAGPWAVIGTTLSYPCSEGWWVVHGTTKLSLDGVNWVQLPFPEGTPGKTRSGTAVNASAAFNGNLILGGEQNGVATFWIGEPR